MAKSVEAIRANLGGIVPEQLYPIAVLSERTGFGKTAFRSLRQKGLKVQYVLGRAFCLGSDFIDFVQEAGSDKKWS